MEDQNELCYFVRCAVELFVYNCLKHHFVLMKRLNLQQAQQKDTINRATTLLPIPRRLPLKLYDKHVRKNKPQSSINWHDTIDEYFKIKSMLFNCFKL